MSRAIFPLHFPDRHPAPQHLQRAGGGHRPRHRLRQQGGHAGVHRPHHLRRHRGRISPPEKSPSSCGWAALRWNWRGEGLRHRGPSPPVSAAAAVPARRPSPVPRTARARKEGGASSPRHPAPAERGCIIMKTDRTLSELSTAPTSHFSEPGVKPARRRCAVLQGMG